jgi:ABC-type multidrug transport system ATPase subunit/signal transduction histidine kinase
MVVAGVDLPVLREASQEPLVAVRGLFASYGSLKVLNGVDFEVRPGELVALTGENGSGKSTLVRCIAGDLAPTGGEVSFAGNRVRGNSLPAAHGLAVVWQDASVCDNLDVSANLFLGREQSRWYMSETKAIKAADEVLASYGIRFASSRPARALSKGQRQLVAVARAMLNSPRLLVLDEPTASLDAQAARQVEELIAQLKARGTTVLLVSHDMEQVFSLADRILVLHAGRVTADLVPAGTHPDEVVAIMSGHDPGTTARHQLGRLQDLVDQLSKAQAGSSLPLILSALASSLSTGQLCIHLLEEGVLRLVAATGLPGVLLSAWTELPVGVGGGPMGRVAEGGGTIIDEDIRTSEAWGPFSALARAAGARSSWAVPLIGSSGLIGVITGCQSVAGPPHKDQIDLVSIYASYAAGAIERDRLFEQVTARNRVLETLREVLETLAGAEALPKALLVALVSLRRGLRAGEVELWLAEHDTPLRCAAWVDKNGQAHAEPAGRDASDATSALAGTLPDRSAVRPGSYVLGTDFAVPSGTAALVARWPGLEPPEYAEALLGDAAHSVRLALERGEAEEAHQQAAALRRSHQLQRDFLSRLSHELRTPLTAIRGYASSLLASDVTWDDESKARFLNRIAGESARLGRLVGDLLDFSAIESGILRLQPDWCDPALVVEAAVACLPPDRASSVRLDCPAGVPPVWADHDRLEQVFVNLLDNAFRHNDRGVKVSVEVFTQAPGTLHVRVADDGRGLPEELTSYLSGPLSSAPSGPRAPAGAVPAAGLGLSIARGIVFAHGGEMVLEAVERGASFLVRLPLENPGEGAL